MTLTFTAPVIFFGLWALQSWLIERSPWSARTLTALMGAERRRWIETMARRDLRMIDTNIIAGLQSGTAFFASTSLIAIGGAFSLLTQVEPLIALSKVLPFATEMQAAAFEAKAVGLMLIFAYAFLKFGWAYRLFNYTSILVGAVPMLADKADEATFRVQVDKASAMAIQSGKEFARGQRAFFLAIAYLGWFLSDIVFLATTLAIYAMLVHRQFFSPAVIALRG